MRHGIRKYLGFHEHNSCSYQQSDLSIEYFGNKDSYWIKLRSDRYQSIYSLLLQMEPFILI